MTSKQLAAAFNLDFFFFLYNYFICGGIRQGVIQCSDITAAVKANVPHTNGINGIEGFVAKLEIYL